MTARMIRRMKLRQRGTFIASTKGLPQAASVAVIPRAAAISVAPEAAAAVNAMKGAYDTTLTAAEDQQRRAGYLKGYSLGRSKQAVPDLAKVSAMFRSGVEAGFKDGKAHKAKQYK